MPDETTQNAASLTAGRCMALLNPKPMVTTSFCIYPQGHAGTHSWQDTAEDRRERMKQEGWT